MSLFNASTKSDTGGGGGGGAGAGAGATGADGNGAFNDGNGNNGFGGDNGFLSPTDGLHAGMLQQAPSSPSRLRPGTTTTGSLSGLSGMSVMSISGKFESGSDVGTNNGT